MQLTTATIRPWARREGITLGQRELSAVVHDTCWKCTGCAGWWTTEHDGEDRHDGWYCEDCADEESENERCGSMLQQHGTW